MDSRDNDTKVQFEKEQLPFGEIKTPQPNGRLAKFIIKHSGGLIKNEQQANYIIIGTTILIFIISIIILVTAFGSETEIPAPPSDYDI